MESRLVIESGQKTAPCSAAMTLFAASSYPPGDLTQRCHVLMEPLCSGQKLLSECVCVHLTAVLQDWDSSALTQMSSEPWVLHSLGSSAPGAETFYNLVLELSACNWHVVRMSQIFPNDGIDCVWPFKAKKNQAV